MRLRPILSILCAALGVGAAVAAAAGGGPGEPGAIGDPAVRLERELGPGVEIASHRETGAVRFLGTPPGRPLRRDPRLGPRPDPSAAALAFADAHGAAFGLDPGFAGLRVASVVGDRGGRTAVRLQQEIDGVPVLAGELAIAVDGNGAVLSALGELEPDPVDTSATIDAGEARRIALASEAKGRAGGASALRAEGSQLAIYDSRLLGGPGLDVPVLVWQVEVSSPADATLRRLVLVDAKLGVVAEAIDLIATAKDRRVCDAESEEGDYPCAAPYDREEGDEGATGIADIDLAYDFAGGTHDFYADRFGRDSLDGAGLPLISTVRFCVEAEGEEECPYQNAFWDGEQMVYGEGFAAADDVVGHELSHGFTQFTSNLFYWYQSGAINESMSDVFGELVDLTNGAGDDSASVRWLVGEDIPDIGAIRNMKDPTAEGDPDRMTSSNYVADPNQLDNGGVHTNSGVNNKAAYLITDGDTFNGTEVTGIGIDKAARVYYEANATLLTSGSDYADLYEALQQACANSIGEDGITANDCEEVGDAVDATEMNQQPSTAPAPEAPVCGSGDEPEGIFFDNLETPASGNWAHGTLSGADGWYYPQNPNLYSWFDATYATSGATNFWGYDQPATSDSAIAQTSSVAIPTGAVYLRFDHSYAFEDASKPDTRYDGGQLEYSVDGGSTWLDAGPLFTHNGYNGTITTKFDNPLEGEAAFTAESNGYISSRVDLSSLAGEEVRFRFRIGSDEIVDDYGWFVDDIHVYECVEAEPPPDETPPETTIVSGPPEPTDDPTPTFSFSADEEPVTFECRLDSSEEAGWETCTSPHTTATLSDGAHSFEVRATDAAENTDGSPAKREFTVDTEAPAAPTGLATTPESPASDNEPLVSGEAEPGSTVRLYATGDCSEGAAAEGGASTFESPGLEVTVPADSTTTFRATAEDEAGNVSSCSDPLEYVEDSEDPETQVDSGPPALTALDSASFEFSGSDPGGSGVASFQCRLDSTEPAAWESCTSPRPYGSLADGPHSFEVRAIDHAGNTDAEPASLEWTSDTEAPDPPTLTATDPASPADENEPLVKGEAEEGAIVRLYESEECSGAPEDEGTAEQFTSPGLSASVLDNVTAQFSATAEDQAGNVSECSSASVTYVEDSTPPQTAITDGPSGPINLDSASFEFSGSDPGGSGVASFQCRLDSTEPAAWEACTSPQPYSSLADGPRSFEVRAIDAAENTDPTPAEREFTVDTEVSEPPEEEPPPEETPPPGGPEESNQPAEGIAVEPVAPLLEPRSIEPDETPPGAALAAPRRQVPGRAVRMRVRCDEPCVAIVDGAVVVWRGKGAGASARARHRRTRFRIGLKRVTRILAVGRTATLSLRPRNRRAPRLLRRLARRGWKARAAVRVRYVDGAGNSATERIRIRLVPRRRV